MVYPTSADEVLIHLAQAGDKEALGALIARHRETALTLCKRILDDDALAEDAVQEACLQALLNIGRLRKPDRFGAWLAGISLNICRGWLRERAREAWSWDATVGGQQVGASADWQLDPEEAAIEADLAARIQVAVAQLPRGQRDAVTLFYISGLTYQEMTVALGIRLGAVKARLHKARTALRSKILQEPEESVKSKQPTAQPIAMRVVDVRRTRVADDQKARHVVFLHEVDGEQGLRIWIGPHEAVSIALYLEKVDLPRPHSYLFLANVLQATGLRLTEARINRLEGEIFYAVARVTSDGGRTAEIDARPSDVINLALVTGAPLMVEPSILSQEAGRNCTDEPLTDENSDGASLIASDGRDAWRPRTSPT